MSLINEALKKAQRARAEGSPADAPPVPGGPIAKRAEPRSAKSVVLIGGGAVALVLLSVVATIYLLSRPDAAPAVATTPSAQQPEAAPTAAAGTPSNASVVVPSPAPAPAVPPTITPPAVSTPSATGASPALATQPTAPVPRTTPAATPPRESPKQTAIVATPLPKAPPAANAPNAATPGAAGIVAPPTTAPAAITPAPAAVAKQDERVAAFVDSVRVTGIRSSGDDSRVLMNERVFRVNDIVERTLGVRLVKVAVDSLTFADANGVTYVKYF